MTPHEMKMAAVEFLVFLQERKIFLREADVCINLPPLLHEFELEQIKKEEYKKSWTCTLHRAKIATKHIKDV